MSFKIVRMKLFILHTSNFAGSFSTTENHSEYVLAAINILYLFLEVARGKRRPQAFRRRGDVHEDEEDAEQAAVDIS